MNTIAHQVQAIYEAYGCSAIDGLAGEAIDGFRILIYAQWTSPMAIREGTQK